MVPLGCDSNGCVMNKASQFVLALMVATLVACGGADLAAPDVFVAEMHKPDAVARAADNPASATALAPLAAKFSPARAAATANALDADAFMNWAQTRLPEFFPGNPATLAAEGFVYRAYNSGYFIGVTTAGDVYALGPVTNGALLALGNLSTYVCAVYPDRCIPQVGTISAQAALSYGKTATLEVVGSALDYGINLAAPGCSTLTELAGSSATQRQYSCKVNAATTLSVSANRTDGSIALSVALPVPDPQLTLVTTKGTIVLELNPAKAPITVNNFLRYANDGFYGNLLFHRVISNFMIQGGGFTTGMVQKAATYAPIKLESNNGLSNVRGTVAMARTNVADSATSQFFINVVDNLFLNYASTASPGYAVFGKVVQGLDVVDLIKVVPTTTRSGYQDVPVTDVLIQSVTQTR